MKRRTFTRQAVHAAISQVETPVLVAGMLAYDMACIAKAAANTRLSPEGVKTVRVAIWFTQRKRIGSKIRDVRRRITTLKHTYATGLKMIELMQHDGFAFVSDPADDAFLVEVRYGTSSMIGEPTRQPGPALYFVWNGSDIQTSIRDWELPDHSGLLLIRFADWGVS